MSYQPRRLSSVRMKALYFLILFLFLGSKILAQQITISADNEPLNNLLVQIRDSSDVQLSFDDKLLSGYHITNDSVYISPEAAIQSLLAELPLKMEQKGIVFLIIPEKKKPKQYYYRGIVKNIRTGEALPYSHLIINGNKTITDLNGNFTFISEKKNINLQASYLGYYIKDTTALHPGDHIIGMEPSIIGLRMVTITDKVIEKASQIGQQAGVMRLNKMIGFHLPGNADNSIFNLLRLQPGILAAGESSNDLLIRNSYEGQSKVIFDGFPIFGVKNYNDNIGAVNPLITKDIEVHKSGYAAKYGGRVGGIVNITGINGNTNDFSLQTNINNFTLNSLVEIPLFKNSSLSLAYRHTYYNLYNPETYTITGNNANNEVPIEISVVPDYSFRDLNVKYSTMGKNGNLFYISLFGAGDKFGYTITEDISSNKMLFKSADEDNQQLGMSLYYGKNWKKGNRSSFILSLGSLASVWNDEYTVTNINNGDTVWNSDHVSGNNISEFNMTFEHHIVLNNSHTLEFAATFIANNSQLTYDSVDVRKLDILTSSARLNGYLQDRLSIGEHIELIPGIRINYAAAVNKIMGEPRLTGSFIANDAMRLNFGLGRYYQFISKTALLDESRQLRYFWITCDGNSTHIIKSNHFIVGPSYSVNGFQVSVELFYTTIHDISRYVKSVGASLDGIYSGEAYTLGLDFYLRKDFGDHSAWASYTLGRTMERFEYFANPLYSRAINDQRHEVKTAILLNFDPWFFSGNYVYGSGMKLPRYMEYADLEEQPYSRLDIAGSFSFEFKSIQMETGISILNLLNTKNLKTSNLELANYGGTNTATLFTQAIPFTPTVNFKVFL